MKLSGYLNIAFYRSNKSTKEACMVHNDKNELHVFTSEAQTD